MRRAVSRRFDTTRPNRVRALTRGGAQAIPLTKEELAERDRRKEAFLAELARRRAEAERPRQA